MKKVDVVVSKDYKEVKGKDFFVDSIIPISMGLIHNETNLGHSISVMFLFESKMDDEVLYVDTLFQLQNTYELEMVKANPMLIDNFTEEFKENDYKQVMSRMNVKSNYFLSDFTFTKTGADGEPELSDTAKSLLEGITTLKPDPYYTFQAYAFSKDTKTCTIRRVNLDKGQWLQLSQFLYWIMISYPPAPNIFGLNSYKKAKFIPVTGMIYDGCTAVNFMGTDSVMAHFTLYFDNTINVGNSFGFNIPTSEIGNGTMLSNYIDTDAFIKAFSKDDTVLPDRIFTISSPDKMCCLLTGLQDGQILVFTLDPETARRVDWMKWDKYTKGIEDKEDNNETDNI